MIQLKFVVTAVLETVAKFPETWKVQTFLFRKSWKQCCINAISNVA